MSETHADQPKLEAARKQILEAWKQWLNHQEEPPLSEWLSSIPTQQGWYFYTSLEDIKTPPRWLPRYVKIDHEGDISFWETETYELNMARTANHGLWKRIYNAQIHRPVPPPSA